MGTEQTSSERPEPTTNTEPESHEEMGDMGNRSKAYRELGSHEPASAELINAADMMSRDAKVAREAAALVAAQQAKDARLVVQEPTNQRGVAKALEALGVTPEEIAHQKSLSPQARRNLAARSSLADRVKENKKFNPANTVEAAREQLKQIMDDRE